MSASRHTITDGPVAKHIQLSRALARRVADELTPGQAAPSERDLMTEYGLSRATVRRAVEALIADGLLQRVPAKGTFVVEPRVESQLHLASFTQDMRRRGFVPKTLLVSCVEEAPPAAAARALQMAGGQTAWHISRIRLADDQPIAVETGWYPTATFPGLEREDLAGSLYEIFAQRYGCAIDSAGQTLWGEAAGRTVARQLQTTTSTPLLVFQRTSYAQGRPLEYVTSRYRGDRYRVHMELSSQPSTARTEGAEQ